MERNRRGSKQVSLLRTADPRPTRAAAGSSATDLTLTSLEQELRMLIWGRGARKNRGHSVKFEFQRDILWAILTLKNHYVKFKYCVGYNYYTNYSSFL